MQLAGVDTDLCQLNDAVELILGRVLARESGVLAVDSVNLEHLHCFGSGRNASNFERAALLASSAAGHVDWLALLDDPRLAKRTLELTGRFWPNITRSTLLRRVLTGAERLDVRVGFLGLTERRRAQLQPVLDTHWPGLSTSGVWSASTAALDDHETARQLAVFIRRTSPQLLVVCLPKPRQERWIAEHAEAAGVSACLALGTIGPDGLSGGPTPNQAPGHLAERTWRQVNGQSQALYHRIVHQSTYRALEKDSFAITLQQ